MNFYRNALTGITLSLAAAVAVHATNGLYLTGYGPEELGRGGANLAVSDRSLGLNSNPAGIAQLQGDHFTASLAVLAPTLEFENMVNGVAMLLLIAFMIFINVMDFVNPAQPFIP